MIDKSGRGKIIDFGSVTAFSSLNKTIKDQDDGKIRSTPGYYIPYSEAIAAYSRIKKELSAK